jgi:hypothetical protein
MGCSVDSVGFIGLQCLGPEKAIGAEEVSIIMINKQPEDDRQLHFTAFFQAQAIDSDTQT